MSQSPNEHNEKRSIGVMRISQVSGGGYILHWQSDNCKDGRVIKSNRRFQSVAEDETKLRKKVASALTFMLKDGINHEED